eukprot:gene17262-57006_t
MSGVVVMVGGAIGGGLFFELLSSILEKRGAVYMQYSTLKRSLDYWRKREMVLLLQTVSMFEGTPEEELLGLCDIIFFSMTQQTDIYMLVSGSVEMSGEQATILAGSMSGPMEPVLGKSQNLQVDPGEIFGHMALLTGEAVECSAICTVDAEVLVLRRADLNKWIAKTKTFDRSLKNLQRLLGDLRHTARAGGWT